MKYIYIALALTSIFIINDIAANEIKQSQHNEDSSTLNSAENQSSLNQTTDKILIVDQAEAKTELESNEQGSNAAQIAESEALRAEEILAEQRLALEKQKRLQTLVSFCAPCHGNDGNSNTEIYPNLAGQKQVYLLKQLTDFKNKTRDDYIMTGLVSRLSEQDMVIISQYYADVDPQMSATIEPNIYELPTTITPVSTEETLDESELQNQ